MDFRLGDLVIGLFFFMCMLISIFPSGSAPALWAATLSQLTTLVSIDGVTDALRIRS